MTGPRAYRRDGERLAERAEKLMEKVRGAPDNIVRCKKLAREMGDFLARWRGRVPESEEAMLAKFAGIHADFTRRLERHWWISLRDVLEKRGAWWRAEKFQALDGHVQTIFEHAPPTLRAELEQVCREHMGADFDPAEEDPATAEALAQAEAAYRNEVAEMLEDWGERAEGAVLERLERITFEDWLTWRGEVASALAKLGPG